MSLPCQISGKPDLTYFYQEYVLSEELGSGKYSQVYKAIPKNNLRQNVYAFKVINANIHPHRVESECNILKNLDLKYSIKIYGMGTVRHELDLRGFVMELFPGKPMSEIFDSLPTYQIKNKFLIFAMLKAAKGLKELHDLNIVHRDIKNENILCIFDQNINTPNNALNNDINSGNAICKNDGSNIYNSDIKFKLEINDNLEHSDSCELIGKNYYGGHTDENISDGFVNKKNKKNKSDVTLTRKEEKNFKLQIKIIDFGFAANKTYKFNRFNKIGTYYYISPEICKNVTNHIISFKILKRADIWSLGVLFYFVSRGSYPFLAKDGPELAKKIISNDREEMDSGLYSIDEIINLCMDPSFTNKNSNNLLDKIIYDLQILL